MFDSITLTTIITYSEMLHFQLSFTSTSELPCKVNREGMVIPLKYRILKVRGAKVTFKSSTLSTTTPEIDHSIRAPSQSTEELHYFKQVALLRIVLLLGITKN